MNALFPEGRNFAPIATIGDADLRVPVDLAHEADAPRAEDAAVAIEHQCRTEVDVCFHSLPIEDTTRKVHSAPGGSEAVGEILQRTLAALVAHRAVERMVDEKKFQNTGASRGRFRVTRRDHHALGAESRTRGLQLRHFLDLDDADSARAIDGQSGMEAVVRN